MRVGRSLRKKGTNEGGGGVEEACVPKDRSRFVHVSPNHDVVLHRIQRTVISHHFSEEGHGPKGRRASLQPYLLGPVALEG